MRTMGIAYINGPRAACTTTDVMTRHNISGRTLDLQQGFIHIDALIVVCSGRTDNRNIRCRNVLAHSRARTNERTDLRCVLRGRYTGEVLEHDILDGQRGL
jgi:hypothetical protein